MHSIETAAHRPLEASLPPHGVSVLESHHARDFHMESEAHYFFQILYVLRGAGTLICPNQRDFSLRSGDVALLPPHTAHNLRDAAPVPLSIYAVNFAPHFVESLPELREKPRRLRRETLQNAMPELLRRLLLEQTLQKTGFEAMMSGFGLQLLATIARNLQNPAPISPDKNLDVLSRVHAYRADLERTFYRAESVDSVALQLGISRRQFTALFRQISGDSWLQTVRKLRVAHAQKLLRESNRTVLAIAFECGYEDLSSFYRAFKTEIGQSPDGWRKSNPQ
jgi:AraC family L-rhamnose operon regulatory protein RhaS